MYRTTQRIRKAGVAALVAATALSGLAFVAPPAGAAAADNTDLTLTALSSPTIGVGKASQSAGDERLTVTTGDTLTAGNQILIAVDDSDVGANCAAATDKVGFSSLPTVSVTGTATVVSSVEESAGCAADLGAAVNDVLRINVTGSGTATINITGIAYTVGAGAANGPVQVNGTLGGLDIVDADASNAFISTAVLTANNPAKGAATAAGGTQTISPLVIAEQTADGADGDLCITLTGANFMNNVPALAQPTVAVSGGGDTATITALSTTLLVLDVTAPALPAPASASTFTISGIVLDTDAAGFTMATLNTDGGANADECAIDVGPALSVATNAGFTANTARFGGSDRFVTAQILFENGFVCPNSVVIARGDLFPDALAASYLAGNLGTGVLLTNSDSVPAATLNALRNEGVNNVYLVGGTSAISAAVATELDATTAYTCASPPVPEAAPNSTTLTVQRIGGADRYDTAQLIAEFPGLTNAGTLDLDPNVAGGNARTAIVASGENFPDALAAGPLAYRGDAGDEVPLLLTRQAAIPAQTLGALGDLGIVNVVVLGGTAAVSDAAVAQLTAAGYNVRRIAGANRQATAAALATVMNTEWGFSAPNASLARGDNFPDALAGGPFAGANANPQAILLTGSATSLSSETGAFLTGSTLITNLNIFGGTAAVSAGVIQAALDAASQ